MANESAGAPDTSQDPVLPELEDARPDRLSTDIPVVESPYKGKLSVGQHLAISAYWFATNFLWGAMLVIMLPDEIKHLAPHMRAQAVGLITGISSIVALTVPLLAGALSDRCAHPLGRRRPFIASGVLINVIGLLLMDFVYKSSTPIAALDNHRIGFFEAAGILLSHPGYVSFLLAFMVVQFGNNVASAAYSGIIPDVIPPDQRGVASGYMALMSQAGTLFGAIGCGLLLRHQTETVKYLVILAVMVVVAMMTILGVRETPLPKKPPPMDWKAYLKSLWIDPKKYPDFAWVWITRALVMLGFYAVLPFINYYLGDVIGLKDPSQDASLLIGIILLASTVSGYYGGKISDRIGRKRVVYLANGLIAVVSLGFILCRNLLEVLAVGVLFGVGYGAYISVDWALGTDVLPSKVDAAKEMAVWHISMTAPQAFASPIAGALIAAFGMHQIIEGDETVYHYTVAGYGAVFVLCSICFALGAYFLKNVKSVK